MTWVTLADANTYFSASINRDTWNDSTDDTKKQAALDSAFRLLNNLYSSQVEDPVQDNLKYANYEQAYCMFTGNNTETADDKQNGVKSKSIGDYSVTYENAVNDADNLFSYFCNAAKFYLQDFEETRLSSAKPQSFKLKREYKFDTIGTITTE